MLESYKKVGTQNLGKTYNRCVKEGAKTGQFEKLAESYEGDKTDGMSQKAVNAYKRENRFKNYNCLTERTN